MKNKSWFTDKSWCHIGWELSLNKKIRRKMVTFKQLLFLAYVLLKSLIRCIRRKKSEEIKTCSSRKKKIFKGKQQSLYSFNDIVESYTTQKMWKVPSFAESMVKMFKKDYFLGSNMEGIRKGSYYGCFPNGFINFLRTTKN